MAFRLKQQDDYKQDDMWKWSIWIEGSQSELDQIDHIIYKLHPTFPDPVRVSKDRLSNFRIESAGWGEFTILAKVVLRTGEQIRLSHELALHYPDGNRTRL